MDFKKFSDENFDLKEWINVAFQSQKESQQNQEQFVSTLITKLQVFIQEINNSIDETSQQTVQNFPRILRDIDVLKQETFMLKEQMKLVRDDLIKVEKNTLNESMKSLLDLDIMRTNMFNVKMSLQEADNWSQLTSDLDSILQSNNIQEISSHIDAMQSSLSQLEDDTNDYLLRCNLLEDFKNKFETLLSSELIQAFNTKSIEESKNLIHLFANMNRLNESKKYYLQCEKTKIVDKLNEIKQSNQNDQGNHVLKSWFDYLIEVWHNELQWCKQIFTLTSQQDASLSLSSSSHSIVINLLTKCLEEFNQKYLSDYLKSVISNAELDYENEEEGKSCSLDCLNHFKQETDRFALTIYSNASSSGLLKSSQINDLLFKLFQQLYMPYKLISKDYGKLVEHYLKKQLERNIKLNHPDTVECVQLLNNSVTKVFYLIEIELNRCQTYTNSCGLALLIESLKSFLKMYIDEFKRIIVNLKERKSATGYHSLNNTPISGNHQTTTLQTSITVPSSLASYNNKELEHRKEDKQQQQQQEKEEDWDTFRHFVKLIQIVGDLMSKYETLEQSIEKQFINNFVHKSKSSILETNNDAINNNNNTPTDSLLSNTNYKEFLLEDTERIKLNKLIAIIETGDDYSIMKDLLKPLFNLSELVHRAAFDIVFAPIKSLIKLMPKLESSNNSLQSVPLFAMAPQEYITKIGQYLLTLPQNFEPFTMQDNTTYLLKALKKSKLPYLDESDFSDDIMACWLDSISNATVINFSDEILNIQQQISINSQRQLSIDIEFICSVFEDVGLKDYQSLKFILELLKCDKNDFDEVSKSKPAKICSALRKMRAI